jgi:predicted dehydrogenase
MPVLRVGVIGCGEVAQVCHIPNFNLLADKYLITYLCDVSRQALDFCARMVRGGQSPKTTTDPEELCSSPDVDLVLICSADEYHIPHGLTALKHDKWCLIEKPLALCFRDVDAIIEAEMKSKGKVMVGTMRRYAPGFADAVKEVGGMDKITYARVRAIIGNNSNFISQSGTFPLGAPSDVSAADAEDKTRRNEDITSCALEKEFGVVKNEQSMRMLRILGGQV